jgi:hypothetical protein
MLKYKIIENVVVAELTENDIIISDAQDFLDLIGDSVSNNCSRIIMNDRNFHEDFFRLHTGLAGEILQKCSNYNFKLAIIGDYTRYNSISLHDFIRESNKGRSVFFVNNFDDALNRIVKK